MSASSSNSGGARRADLRGREVPRLWTRPLRELTPATSLGFDAIDFASEVCGIDLLHWQRWWLIHALELREDGTPRFRTVLLLVARQNGKTVLLKVLALFWMYVLRRQLVIGSAQDLPTAEKTWEEVVDMIDDVPDLLAEKVHVDKANGKKALRLTDRRKYLVKAASRRGGRGFTADLIELDELREHLSWDAWSAISKTTMAVSDAVIVGASNAGNLSSIVLWHLRKVALTDVADWLREAGDTAGADRVLSELADPSAILDAAAEDDEDDLEDVLDFDDDSLGIFEWSAAPGCARNDREGIAQANPSLGETITLRAILAAMKTDDEWEFRTEVLCQWRMVAAAGPFPDGAWAEGIDADSRIAPDSPIAVCVELSHNRSVAYVLAAGRREDGHVHVELLERSAGTEWLVPWLTSPDRLWARQGRTVGLVFRTAGAPVSSLKDDLEGCGLPVVPWAGADEGRACGQMYDLVAQLDAQRRVFHRPVPALDVAATSAKTKPSPSGGWVLDMRNSPVDCAPLYGAIGAAWALGQIKEPTKSAYETRRLVVAR